VTNTFLTVGIWASQPTFQWGARPFDWIHAILAWSFWQRGAASGYRFRRKPPPEFWGALHWWLSSRSYHLCPTHIFNF
jgi:hypothetical protein